MTSARRNGWIRRTLESAQEGPAATEPASEPPSQPKATIAAGCELEGELQLPGPLTVHGDFKGAIDCRDDVIVGPGGTVQGPIRARSVEVQGSVVGDLLARREVVLRPGSRLHGDITSASLVVERGACFEGRSVRAQPIAPRPLAEPTPDTLEAPPQTSR